MAGLNQVSAGKSIVISDEDGLNPCFFSIQIAFWMELREMYNNISRVVFFSLGEKNESIGILMVSLFNSNPYDLLFSLGFYSQS